jgi:hypothetical protein
MLNCDQLKLCRGKTMPLPRFPALLALLIWGLQVAEAKTYEEFFTEKANQAYNEDINVWTYTSEFANRFAMPKEWIDDDLEGAYAVAFRVETASGRIRFPHKGPNVSMINRRCILDVYVDEKAPIPWANDQTADFWFYTPSSPTYLLPQNARDRAWRSRAVGIAHPGKQARRPLVYMSGGSIHLREYDKEVYPGISYMSFNISCVTPPRNSTSIEFRKDVHWVGDKYQTLHKIDVPSRYMKRLYSHWYQQSRRPSQEDWQSVTRPRHK